MTPAIPISAEFLERLRRRDPEALAEAVHEHARPLLRAAKALDFPEPEAEDMVQDVFRTFLERLDNFEGRSQLRKWLSGILHRKALERHRAAERRAVWAYSFGAALLVILAVVAFLTDDFTSRFLHALIA